MMSAFLTCLLFSSALFAALDCSDAIRPERPRTATGDGGSLASLHRRGRGRVPPVYVGPQVGRKEADRIAALPGQPVGGANPIVNQYAGYVTVEPGNGRALFYYFVESPTEPTKKPLVLWLNGGPGGSSLGYGAMLEIGPFRVNSDGRSLRENVYAWTNVANIIFLESPVGVGFSYSNTSSDYRTNGDRRTARDSLTFLVNWLERYPEYKNRDFYITGESYAGHYIPQLSKLILLQNNKTHKPINLKGIAMGNADLEDNLYVKARYEFLWSHAMYSDETHALILRSCNGSSMTTSDCMRARFQAGRETGRINYYNIYASLTCNENHSSSNVEYDPCASGYVFNYLNNPSVQNALHAVPRNWSAYSMLDWSDSEPSMLKVMKQLIASGLRVLLYSGDLDAAVPVTFTKSFIRLLRLPVESPWRPWYNVAEVGGYVVGYKGGLSFVTVTGAGHEVPSYQGERALHMISSFFQGNLP